MKALYSWIKEYVDIEASAEDVAQRLTMSGLEVQACEMIPSEKDAVLDVEITSNRPDWLSHIGIARECSALYKKSIKYPKNNVSCKRESPKNLRITVKDVEKCPYYTAVLLENVSFGKTPDFIKRRLECVGLRSINLPVDLTNYILLEYGQPLHAFDFDKIGNEVIVRSAKNGELFKAINEKQYELTNEDLVISDENGIIALAGVMGGKKSEVSDETKNILLESALFAPHTIRASSRRHGLVSDSSYRFERFIDPQGVCVASDRFIHLLLEYGNVERVSVLIENGSISDNCNVIELSYNYMKKILGAKIPNEEAKEILTYLDLTIVEDNDTACKVRVPSFRSDLTRPVDVVEEVARIYGYDSLKETYPTVSMRKKTIDPIISYERKLRNRALSLGTYELVTFSLVDPSYYEKCAQEFMENIVRIINPSNKKLTIMRPSLIDGVMEVIKHNLNHGNKHIKTFEIGRTYKASKNGLPSEEKKIAIALTGEIYNNWKDHARNATFFDLKGMVETLLNQDHLKYKTNKMSCFEEGFDIYADNVCIGYLGIIDSKSKDHYDIKQDVFYAELSVETSFHIEKKNVIYQEYSKYPSSYRDLSIVIKDVYNVEDVLQTIQNVDQEIIANISLFDLYRGKPIAKGEKSLSFAIEYQSKKETLSSERVDELHTKIIKILEHKFNASLR